MVSVSTIILCRVYDRKQSDSRERGVVIIKNKHDFETGRKLKKVGGK